jgi:hypothetical protein
MAFRIVEIGDLVSILESVWRIGCRNDLFRVGVCSIQHLERTLCLLELWIAVFLWNPAGNLEFKFRDTHSRFEYSVSDESIWDHSTCIGTYDLFEGRYFGRYGLLITNSREMLWLQMKLTSDRHWQKSKLGNGNLYVPNNVEWSHTVRFHFLAQSDKLGVRNPDSKSPA